MDAAAPLGPQLEALTSGVAVVEGPPPDLFALTGPGHLEALDRIVSQAVKGLAEGEGRLALLLAPKGQFRALMAVYGGRAEAVLAAPAGRGPELASGLGKYLAFSKARLEPLAASGALAVLGPGWAAVASACGADVGTLERGGWSRTEGEGGAVRWLGRTLAGIPGVVVVCEDARALARVRGEAIARGAMGARAEAVEAARIDAMWPAWGAELTGDVLPAEVGLEAEAVSFTKGCYVGQETVARLRTYGRPNRVLVRVAQCEGPGVVPPTPAPLVLRGEDSRRGVMTSASTHPRHGIVGLALVRREGAAPGARWLATDRAFVVSSSRV